MFCKDKHFQFIIGEVKETRAQTQMEATMNISHRINAVYWTISSFTLMKTLDRFFEESGFSKEQILEYVTSCIVREDGLAVGFAGDTGLDAHILYTTSGVQILLMLGALNDVLSDEDAWSILRAVKGLQDPATGCFYPDPWKEVDTRFNYCACLIANILISCKADALSSRLGRPVSLGDFIDVEASTRFIMSCANEDGGFGASPKTESHGGQAYCCVAALAIMGRLDRLPSVNKTRFWLVQRQHVSGGFTGRPEKDQDICYSWWIGSPLYVLSYPFPAARPPLHTDGLRDFILRCQDHETGGISDRVENMPDAFHTFFGVAGLSLYGLVPDADLEPIDPCYALPTALCRKQGLVWTPLK